MNYDYDKAPTDPAHGGKLTAEMAASEIARLRLLLSEAVELFELSWDGLDAGDDVDFVKRARAALNKDT